MSTKGFVKCLVFNKYFLSSPDRKCIKMSILHTHGVHTHVCARTRTHARTIRVRITLTYQYPGGGIVPSLDCHQRNIPRLSTPIWELWAQMERTLRRPSCFQITLVKIALVSEACDMSLCLGNFNSDPQTACVKGDAKLYILCSLVLVIQVPGIQIIRGEKKKTEQKHRKSPEGVHTLICSYLRVCIWHSDPGAFFIYVLNK